MLVFIRLLCEDNLTSCTCVTPTEYACLLPSLLLNVRFYIPVFGTYVSKWVHVHTLICKVPLQTVIEIHKWYTSYIYGALIYIYCLFCFSSLKIL